MHDEGLVWIVPTGTIGTELRISTDLRYIRYQESVDGRSLENA